VTDPRREALELIAALRRTLATAAAAGIDGIPRGAPRAASKTPSTAVTSESAQPASPATAGAAAGLFDAAPPPAPPMSREEKLASLEKIAAEARACTRCRLHEGRTHAVPGEGNPDARLLFVGEGPGENEDLQGRPFVGRAGELLTKIIEGGMGLRREEVFIANVVKCRPPGNRTPLPDEAAACLPYLRRQIEALRPELVVALGRPAAAALLETDAAMAQLRGRVERRGGQRILATYHPAYLLRNPHAKKEVWEDIQVAMRELGLPVPKRPRE